MTHRSAGGVTHASQQVAFRISLHPCCASHPIKGRRQPGPSSLQFGHFLAAALLLLAAPLAASADEPVSSAAAPQTFSAKAGAISGLWQAEQPSINAPQPIAYVAAITQGRTVAFTGALTTDPATPVTGAGYFANTAWVKGSQLKIKAQTPSHLLGKYPIYQAYFATGSAALSGWYTLVLADYNTVIPFEGKDPEIEFPPVAAPGQLILKRTQLVTVSR